MLVDIKKAQEDAATELAEEAATKAKSEIKGSLRKIAQAKAVVANLEREHEVLLRTIGE
jgi:hypothetical protein